MGKIHLKIICPKCSCIAKAEIKRFFKFIIFVCPYCRNNVVHYADKVAIISDKLINSLRKNKRFKFYGNASFSSPKKNLIESKITDDCITDLKILLETERDFNKLLSKL